MFPRAGSNSTLSLWILALAMALEIAFALLAAFVLFPSGILKVFAAPTRGLVTATLGANFISLAVIVGLVLCLIGGLRLSDLGLRGSDLPIAVVLTVSVWIGVNAIEGAWQAVADGAVSWGGEWQGLGVTAVIGALLAQLFGNALYEEILFRGVLLRQTYWRLETTRLTNLQTLAIAIAISQSVFALIHLPISAKRRHVTNCGVFSVASDIRCRKRVRCSLCTKRQSDVVRRHPCLSKQTDAARDRSLWSS
jgi:uncharacterized protein